MIIFGISALRRAYDPYWIPLTDPLYQLEIDANKERDRLIEEMNQKSEQGIYCPYLNFKTRVVNVE